MYDNLAHSCNEGNVKQEKEHWIGSERLDTTYQSYDWSNLTETLFPHLQNKDNGAYFSVAVRSKFLKSPDLTAITKLPWLA